MNSLFAINILAAVSIPQILDSCRAIGRTQEVIEERHLMPAIAPARQHQIQATVNLFSKTTALTLASPASIAPITFIFRKRRSSIPRIRIVMHRSTFRQVKALAHKQKLFMLRGFVSIPHKRHHIRVRSVEGDGKKAGIVSGIRHWIPNYRAGS